MAIPETALENNIPTQDYLKELLSTAIGLEAECAEKQQQRQIAETKFAAVHAKIQQAIVQETELKRNRLPEHLKHDKIHDHSKDANDRFAEQFSQLQRIMGISIVCIPEQKQVEITFNDDKKTNIKLSYDDKGISIDEMTPAHPNLDAIRTHLRETRDLVGFLSVLRKKLTFNDI
uniref:Kinetochore protein SPC25 n=1 Tax=Anopheles minimus TaxID=112268 RepID=A0A182VY36_9DIPT